MLVNEKLCILITFICGPKYTRLIVASVNSLYYDFLKTSEYSVRNNKQKLCNIISAYDMKTFDNLLKTS